MNDQRRLPAETTFAERPPGHRFLPVGIAVAALVAIYVAWVSREIGGARTADAVDNFGQVLAALLAAVSLCQQALRERGRRRSGWLLFGLSAAVWAAGSVVSAYYEVLGGTATPFPSLADAGYLASLPLAIAGALSFGMTSSSLVERSRRLLDAAVASGALLLASWGLGVSAVYHSDVSNSAVRLLGTAYPFGDVIVLTILLLTVRRAAGAFRGQLLLLIGGYVAITVADAAFNYVGAAVARSQVFGPVDAGWVAGYLLVAIAPLWRAGEADARMRRAGDEGLWQRSLHWGAVVLAGGTLLLMAVRGERLSSFGLYLAATLLVLVVASQILNAADLLSALRSSRATAGELDARNRLLDRIIANAPNGIALVGIDLKIIQANPRLRELLGVDRELAGNLVSDYLPADEMERVVAAFLPLWRGEVDLIANESQALRGDGSKVWLAWTASAIRNSRGRIDYFLAMYQDVTAEHEMQAAAEANRQELARLNKLKSEFISVVSHEFRTALTGIQGFSEVIRDEHLSDAEVKEFAGDIHTDALRLGRMINEMLDLDRIESGRLRLHLGPVDVNATVIEAAGRAQATTSRCEIKLKLARHLPPISADADRLTQVVSNLLSNAVKYSPDGGDIVVRTRHDDGKVTVSVKDHGLGIPPNYLSKVFDRYERYESEPTSRIIGTGLGLPIAREIVQLHGGTMWVESEFGRGSEFHFTLPLAAEAQAV